MAELNDSEAPASQIHHNNEENNETTPPACFPKDNAMESEEKPIQKNTADLISIPKGTGRLDSDNNLLLPLLKMDALPPGNSNTSIPHHLFRKKSKDPESPCRIMEASDPFLDPALYKRYSICTDIEDTFHERLAKKMETIKDVTRDRAVSSITAGENAVHLMVKSFKFLTSGWLGLFILLITIVFYGSFGAIIFMLLESPYEELYNMRIFDIRKELANKIEEIARNETVMMTKPDFLTLIQDDLIAYENQYSEFIKHVHNNDISQKTWDFWNSFIFAGTIFTTIGYGHIVPKTTSGRAATIVYAIIGIPLFLVVLASFGKFLTRIIKFFWAYISCSNRIKFGRNASVKVVRKEQTADVYRPSLVEDKSEEISNVDRKSEPKPDPPATPAIEIDEEFNLPTPLAISILVIYMLFGALVAYYAEQWSYFDAFYCIFISMSTIGLGDFVVSNSMHMIYSIVYIIFGLSLTAMCIEVVQRNLSVMFKHACEKVMMLVEESDSNLESTISHR